MGNWFSGSCTADVDARGSFLLPPFVETALAKVEHRFALLVEPHPHLPCLLLKMSGCGTGPLCPKSRRLTLPPRLRTHAAIGPRMLAVSAGGHVELWDPLLGSLFGDADVRLLGRFEQYMEAEESRELQGARYRFRPRPSGSDLGESALWKKWTFN